MTDIAAVKSVVETWNIRKHETGGFNQRDLRRWVELMNALTKRLIHMYGVRQTDFYLELYRSAVDAHTVLSPGDEVLPGDREHAARELIRTFEVEDAEFFTGLFELAQHACTVTTPSARVIADGVDRTNV